MTQQQSSWSDIDQTLNLLFSSPKEDSLPILIPKFFKINLVRATPLFIIHFLSSVRSHPENTSVLASLLTILNSRLPDLGLQTIRCLLAAVKQEKAHSMLSIIGYLVRHRTVSDLVGLQIFAFLLSSSNLSSETLEGVCAFLEASCLMNRQMRDTLRKIIITQKMSPALIVRFKSLLSHSKSERLPEFDEDIVTHEIDFDEVTEVELSGDLEIIDEAEFEENENKWKEIAQVILSEEEIVEAETAEDDLVSSEEKVQLRKKIYLTLMSSVNADEAAHKILKHTNELVSVVKEVSLTILEACAVEKVYKNFHATVSERLMRVKNEYKEIYGEIFVELYEEAYKVETDKLRIMAKFFGHLLAVDILDWRVFAVCRLTEEDTTAGCRVLLKFLFQEIAELMGNKKMNERMEDDKFLDAIGHALFPMDTSENLRFAINFFTAIGLGAMTQAARRRLAAVLAGEQIADHDRSYAKLGRTQNR